MRRPATAALVLLVAAGLASVPAQAAPKKKPKPITGSYALQMPPDPAAQVTSVVPDPVDGYCGPSPASQDVRTIKVPAKGSLKIVLEMQNPTGTGQVEGLDWDLHVYSADGEEIDSSTSGGGREETVSKLKKKQTLTVVSCNLTGLPQAKVTHVFTYA